MKIETVSSNSSARQRKEFRASVTDAPARQSPLSTGRKWVPKSVLVAWERTRENDGEWNDWTLAEGGVEGVRLKMDGVPAKNGQVFDKFWTTKKALNHPEFGEWVATTLTEVREWS